MKLFKQFIMIVLLMAAFFLSGNINLQEQDYSTAPQTMYPKEALSTTLRSAQTAKGEQPRSTAAERTDDQTDWEPEVFESGLRLTGLQGVSRERLGKMADQSAQETNNAGSGQTGEGLADQVEIPILLYHHIAEEANGDITISERTFRSHIEAIDDAGFTAITFEELVAYVEDGAPLPEKPVILTFDDGYRSNYEIAYPLLKELGMKATFFPIGVSLGKDVYKDTGSAITPHFGFAEIREMTASGVISIQSHTYDMHQTKNLDDENTYRVGVLPRNGEIYADYKYMFYKDAQLFRDLLGLVLEEQLFVFSYPFGAYNEDTEEWLDDLGFKVTLMIGSGSNIVERGNGNSLKLLNRFDITEAYSAEDVLALLSS